jgi:peroxiredoxin Q/BCP
MMRKAILLAGVLAASAAAPAAGQEAAVPPPLEVGAVAPDFALPGATRFGVLANPVRLSDYKGKVVVLAFFFRARTRG